MLFCYNLFHYNNYAKHVYSRKYVYLSQIYYIRLVCIIKNITFILLQRFTRIKANLL